MLFDNINLARNKSSILCVIYIFYHMRVARALSLVESNIVQKKSRG